MSREDIVSAVREKLSKGGDLPSQRGETGELPVHDVVRESSPVIAPVGDEKKRDVLPESSPGEVAEVEKKAETDKDRNFAKLRDQLKEERARSAELAADLKEATGRKKAVSPEVAEAFLNPAKPDDFDEWSDEQQTKWAGAMASKEEIAKQFGPNGASDIRKLLLENQAMKQLPGINGNQAEFIAQVHEKAGGALDWGEAQAIAAHRKPTLFPEPEPAVQAPEAVETPVAHRVQEPSRSGNRRVPEDPANDLREAVHTAPTVAEAKSAMQRRVKHMLFHKG